MSGIIERAANTRAGVGGSGTTLTALTNSGLGSVFWAAGDTVQIWVRHRSTITAAYLTNAADPGVGLSYAQRVNIRLDGDSQLHGTTETDGQNKLTFGAVNVPANGFSYDRVVVTLIGGTTSNELLVTCFNFADGLLLPRDTNADNRCAGSSSPPGATPSNITHMDHDVLGPVAGETELVLIAVASSAVLNAQTVNAPSGFTLLPVPGTVGSPRLIAAYKVVSALPLSAGGAGRATLSWSGAGTACVGRTVSLQESAPVTGVPIQAHWVGYGVMGMVVGLLDTTVHIPIGLHMEGLDHHSLELGKVDIDPVGGNPTFRPSVVIVKGL